MGREPPLRGLRRLLCPDVSCPEYDLTEGVANNTLWVWTRMTVWFQSRLAPGRRFTRCSAHAGGPALTHSANATAAAKVVALLAWSAGAPVPMAFGLVLHHRRRRRRLPPRPPRPLVRHPPPRRAARAGRLVGHHEQSALAGWHPLPPRSKNAWAAYNPWRGV